MEVLISNKIPSNTDCFIYLFCNNYKNEIKKIENLLDIKFPKKMFENFKGETQEVKITYFDEYCVVLGGIGSGEKCNLKNINNTVSMIGKLITEKKFKNIIFTLLTEKEETLINQIESILLGSYKFEKYLTEKKQKNKLYIYNSDGDNDSIKKGVNNGIILNKVRDMVNEPPNKMNSIIFEREVKNTFKNSNISVNILGDKELEKKGMNLILAVNSGSKYPAKFIILSNKNKDKSEKAKVFIGKGVTFDAGGLNIKNEDFSDMKTDMSGAALVYGLFMYINENNIRGNYIGLLPIVENMVDSKSFRPGDIIKAYNKKTVEIIDTDAEGRLILADSIAYSSNYNPEYIVDIATLTGSAASMFNDLSIVIMGNNKDLIKKMENSCTICNEKIWELPIWEEYIEYTKSEIADYKNYTVDVSAGAIMGGAFLSNFLPKNTKWFHLDIAGVSYLPSGSEYLFSGATAYGLKSLFRFIE